VSNLPDAERDACDVVQALAGLTALLRITGPGQDDVPGCDDMALDEARQKLLSLAEDGGAAAARVLAYLRMLRGPGDGAAVTFPARLGPWREWVPSRGHLLGDPGGVRRVGGLPQPRRCDPGE
jgi:hypothetical protein